MNKNFFNLMVFVFIIISLIQCTSSVSIEKKGDSKVYNEYIKAGNNDSITTNFIYLDSVDRSNYIKINFYFSGDTFSKEKYDKGILKSRHSWTKNNVKVIEEDNILGERNDTVFLKVGEKTETVIAKFYIGNVKYRNEKGIITYETNLLPGRKEQRIKRDSIGNVLKIDTISY